MLFSHSSWFDNNNNNNNTYPNYVVSRSSCYDDDVDDGNITK